MIPRYPFEDLLGLDIKRDPIPCINNYKVAFVGFVKYYKAPIKMTVNGTFAKRIEIIGKGLKKMLSNVEGEFDIIDAQIIYRPAVYGNMSTLAAKAAIRFASYDDWMAFKNKHKENLYRNEMKGDLE